MPRSDELPSMYFHVCPACRSTDVTVWERFSETHNDTIGGKDCNKCGAMSRRWISEGVGFGIWADGPGLSKGMPLGVVQEILSVMLAHGK
jgi:hypothetical protein